MQNTSWTHAGIGIATAVLLSACGGGGTNADQAGTSAAASSTSTVPATPASTGVSAPTATATTVPVAPASTQGTATDATAGTSRLAAAIRAAKDAAATDPLCSVDKLGDFYWEIGDATGSAPIVSGTQGSGSVTAASNFNIASASKWVFGAYVLEKKGFDQVRNDPSLRAGMHFTSGYTGLSDDACAGKLTVGGCFTAGMNGNTSAPDPATVGKFDYDGGHDQKLAAVDLGLANYTSKQLDQEYQSVLGLSPGFNMAPLEPLMAGGLFASANDYAQFLRKIMNQQLVIGAHLGEDSVCTLFSACPGQVAYSPIAGLGEPWRYSYNHWVESEKGNGTVDAYSSPGKWGFYPWITPDRKYYGVLSRHDTHPTSLGVSMYCGRQIRKAFLGAL